MASVLGPQLAGEIVLAPFLGGVAVDVIGVCGYTFAWINSQGGQTVAPVLAAKTSAVLVRLPGCA